MVDPGAMVGSEKRQWKRACAVVLCMICLLALIPASYLAYVGLLWFPGLEGSGAVSAAALVAGPFPLAAGLFLAWRSFKGGQMRSLLAGIWTALLALGLYAISWAFGGRMLL